ncbi:MAG: hypothetical protein WC227_01660 [Patescibacteria group bacterium]|jgi:hypothetical protein
MDTELLRQILILTTIAAVVLLIMIFCRVYDILGDAKIVSSLSVKRAKQIDGLITKGEQIVTEYIDGFKGFLSSVGFIKNIVKYFENNKKGENDGKE